ncbi:hypothetical protein Btru_022858 [Bulinus truncatus]|nr:hypothetical protein Btru_022858 [Bulinus truncatus]
MFLPVSRNPCANYTCLNGGSCTSPLDYPYCVCPPGFNGTKCEIKLPAAQCPVINSQSVGICGGVFCESNSDCSNGQICCPSACGSRLCTAPQSDVQQTTCPKGCPSGCTCELRPMKCSPGMMCPQVMVPTCVPRTDECGGCPVGTSCKDTGLRCITSPCPTFQCVAVDACGGCPRGQKCVKLFPPCAPPPPCDEASLVPCERPVCAPIDTCVPDETIEDPRDACGNCPSGQVCKPTGIVCIRAPCPTHKCVAEVTPSACNLACKRNYVCQLKVPNCPKNRLRCPKKPVPQCVPKQKQLASCPKPAQDKSSVLTGSLQRNDKCVHPCSNDNDCGNNERCCPGLCINRRQCTVVPSLP